ncbi:histidine--tRNA ligase [Psychroflexus salis]|uniref:Histidine--tRNA ligase n=1 Tax=Psychroflexus salis TaxID=1526574 RepID=A0A916ZQA3_9FLAO|nr:histidine--tRNA ligase [Psychroflexus salis]GGE08791.1 histidine--tRNA ligase [Psychroflexus salis]
MAQKPGLPKGTRDFSPEEVAKRNYIIQQISHHFSNFGFQPIETPSFENNSTLLGKYGEEGDRLIFKILNSGDFLSKVKDETYQSKNSNTIAHKITEKSLRYDLTVPFARYVVQHQNEIDFPFKRYQIQNVYRADRPQKGRFREFTQCDADVIGSKSLWQEVEFIQLYDAVFSSLNLKGVEININNRKVLSGLAEVIGETDKLIDFTVALDKLDKIGRAGVEKEMLEKGISQEAIVKLAPVFQFSGDFEHQLQELSQLLSDSAIGLQGIEELQFISKCIQKMPLATAKLKLNITLARGLNYYTGCIFEVSAPSEVKMGSIGGGGRYDDLTGIFGLKDMSGVGVSFGLDRIYLVLEELDLFPKTITEGTQILFINFGEKEALYALKAVSQLRKKGFSVDLYPDAAKMKKQMNFANKRNIPYVILAGEAEIQKEVFTLKNMKSREQFELNLAQISQRLQDKFA